MRKTLPLLLLTCLSAVAQVDTSYHPRDTWPYYCPGIGGTNTLFLNYPICVNVRNYGAVGDGVTVCDTAFANALAACTNGGAIYIPARVNGSFAVYKLNSGIAPSYTKQVAWIGATNAAGNPIVTLVVGGANPAFDFGEDTTRTTASITGGLTRGSRTITVSTASGLQTGDLIRFYQNDQNNYPDGWFGSGEFSNPRQGEMAMITNISSTTLTLDKPVYYTNYQSGLSPTLDAFHHQAKASGIQNLGINYQGTHPNIIKIYVAQNIWVYNCRTTNSVNAHVELQDAYQCSVVHNQTWFHQSYDSNNRSGIQLDNYSAENLIMDNANECGNLGILIQESASGNVVAYNFGQMGWVGNGTPGNGIGAGNNADGLVCHGDNAFFNLFEGNVTPWISFDEYWGENRKNVMLRNWMRRWGYGDTNTTIINQGQPGVFIDATNYYHVILGNVVGSPRDVGDATSSHTAWDIGYMRRAGYDWPQPMNDLHTTNWNVWHHNYDYVTQAILNSNSIPTLISNSYFLGSKPSFFGIMAWPPIGPDVNTNQAVTTVVIPAQYLEINGTNPPTQDPYITIQPSSITVNRGNTGTFSVTAGGNSTLSYQWKKGGVNISGATQSSYTTPAVDITDSGASYACVVSDSNGNLTSSSATLNVELIATQPSDQTVLVGQPATFSVVGAGSPPFSYQWYRNGILLSGATLSSYTIGSTLLSDSGAQFSVNLGVIGGSEGSRAALLTVNGSSGLPSYRINGKVAVGGKTSVNWK